jgi:hypothetical protein
MENHILLVYFLYIRVVSANLCRLHRLIADRLNQLIVRIPFIHYSQADRAVNDCRFSYPLPGYTWKISQNMFKGL